MPQIDRSKVKRILVITLSNLGDIILTTPVIETLLKEFPSALLDVMVGEAGRRIFERREEISTVIIYDKKSSALAKFRLFLELRRKKYNLVVDLRHTVLPFVLGAKYNSFPSGRQKEANLHKKDVHLLRLKDLGIKPSGHFYIPIPEEDRKYVDDLLGELETGRFVVVSPGAKSHVKRWPLKHFAALCDLIKKNLGYEVVLIGDKYDRVVIERILFYAKTKPVNLIEKTNINQLAYLVKKSSLLITNDSAPLHVGSAVGAKILAFFGPTDEKKYGPVSQNTSKVLRRNIPCAPCQMPQCINLNNKYECLKAISSEEAFKAVRELLGDVSRGTRDGGLATDHPLS